MSFTPKGDPVLRPFTLAPADALPFLQNMAPPPYGQSLRCLQLERYEAFFRGEQYKHQTTDWWGQANADMWETVSPLAPTPRGFERPMQTGLTTRQKRPSIETGMAATVVNDYTALMLSEQAQPRVIVQQDGDTEAMLLALMKSMDWWPKWTYGRNLGGGTGSVAVTWHARDGAIDMEVHNTRQCTVLWRNRKTWTPAAILKTWSVFKDEETVVDGEVGETKRVEWVYRRIITELEDVVFLPIRMDDQNTWDWVADPGLSVTHGLGFFPGIWVQNTPDEEEMDGEPDCEGAWKQIDALDRLLSQINKAVLANVDPTIVLSMDPKESNVGSGLQVGSDSTIEPGVEGDAKFLELMGGGIAAAERICDRLEKYISWRTGWVPIDPSKVGGAAVSSLTLKLMFRSMIQRADKLRAQYGTAIVRGLEIVCKLVRSFEGKTVALPDGENGEKRVGKFTWKIPGKTDEKGKAVPHAMGQGGEISIQWGPYFNATPLEEGQSIENAAKAKTAGLVDQQTAMEHVAGAVFQVRDVEGMAERVAEEQAAEMQGLMEQAGGSASGKVLDDALGSGALGGRRGTDRQPSGDAPS